MEAALRSVNLWNGRVGDKPAGAYSGGMKRRLSVAVSFMGDPLVVYLDEPSTVRMLAWCVQVCMHTYSCTPICGMAGDAARGMGCTAGAYQTFCCNLPHKPCRALTLPRGATFGMWSRQTSQAALLCSQHTGVQRLLCALLPLNTAQSAGSHALLPLAHPPHCAAWKRQRHCVIGWVSLSVAGWSALATPRRLQLERAVSWYVQQFMTL